MVKIGIRFKIKSSFSDALRDVLLSAFGKKARQNFGDFRPTIEDAIDEGVINRRSEFIPDDDAAAELGIGSNGSIDRSRTDGAWTQLLVGSEGIVTFTVRKDTRKNKIGKISININEQAFLNAPLSTIDIESEDLPTIPWMDWFINGAVAGSILPNFDFTNEVPQGSLSRTGGGRMISIEGGVWSFPAASLGAFKILGEEIERQVRIAIRRDIGKVL